MKKTHGFTIVELLVVIVIIGILAAITIVSYTGISRKATEASLQSDLTNASKTIKMHQVENSAYPTNIDCAQPNSATNKCVKSSSGTTYIYNVDNNASPQAFGLSATKSNITYRINRDSIPLQCAPGFIIVPGSATYSTSDFCVMKYEAKQVGATNVPISEAAGLPWTSISQTDAITNSPNVAGCTGCHLITEAEWMTIAQNVLGVASNWSSGIVGTGFIYSGNNNNTPVVTRLAADASDDNGYSGTGESAPSNQKRTLNLSNGEVIWDLAGNVWDWTSGTSTTNQPGNAGNAYASWIEWPSVTIPGTLTPNVFPSGLGIIGASSWNSTNGIGRLLSNPAETLLRGFLRGGTWDNVSDAGVMALRLMYSPSAFNGGVGFRVSR